MSATKGKALIIGALLSSKPGFQCLSKAALSRSRFLRLAAGALLPFVGLRLPAAAATNAELAQNSGAPGTKDTAAPGRMGAILVSQFGPVKIHSYLSPADGLHVNTQMVEGANAVVIFDGQLLLRYADEVASYVQTLGKPIGRIILSHAHTDHWGGLQVLTERFPDARVFALDGIADQVRARGPARLDGLRRIYGDKVATKVTVPTETITEGPQRIDGVTYDFKLLGALDVGHRAVDRGATDGRVMPDDDRVVTLKRLERPENDHPVIEMVRSGEGVLVR
jgi:Metallo-beta-lactamase superfamily